MYVVQMVCDEAKIVYVSGMKYIAVKSCMAVVFVRTAVAFEEKASPWGSRR